LCDENQDAWDLWLEVETQWRMSFSGRVGLDYTVLYQEADRMGIDMEGSTRRKVQYLERLELSRQHEKKDDK
jgi:hypothetical protein